jgi:hypothetical protein
MWRSPYLSSIIVYVTQIRRLKSLRRSQPAGRNRDTKLIPTHFTALPTRQLSYNARQLSTVNLKPTACCAPKCLLTLPKDRKVPNSKSDTSPPAPPRPQSTSERFQGPPITPKPLEERYAKLSPGYMRYLTWSNDLRHLYLNTHYLRTTAKPVNGVKR